MNEPTEFAQRETGKVTAREVLSLLKGAYSANLHGRAAYDRESYSDSFVFTFTATYRPLKGAETHTDIKVPGWVTNGHTDEKNTYTYEGRTYQRYTLFRPKNGSWWLFAKTEALEDILSSVPGSAEVSFQVALDWGTTQAHTEVNMHVDLLYVHLLYTVRGKRVTKKFLLDVSCGFHNTARFGGLQ